METAKRQWQPQRDNILLAAYAKLPVGTSAQRLYDNLVLVLIVKRQTGCRRRQKNRSSLLSRRNQWLTRWSISRTPNLIRNLPSSRPRGLSGCRRGMISRRLIAMAVGLAVALCGCGQQMHSPTLLSSPAQTHTLVLQVNRNLSRNVLDRKSVV